MLGRIAVCGAAAIMTLPVLLLPAHSSAKGSVAAPVHHVGVFGRHFNRHAFRRHHDHRRNWNGDGFAYWPLGGYGDYPSQEIVPIGYPVYVGPRCEHSVETVVVPAESGGSRRITITRC